MNSATTTFTWKTHLEDPPIWITIRTLRDPMSSIGSIPPPGDRIDYGTECRCKWIMSRTTFLMIRRQQIIRYA